MIFSVLVDEWGGGHLVKGDEKEEEVPSSLGEAQAVHSQERAVRENQLDENKIFETKAEMRGAEQQKDNHEKLSKRGVEDGKSKKRTGIPKPVADVIGAKKKKKKERKGKHAIAKKGKGKHTKKGKGKDAKKTKKQQKTGPKKKSRSQMCDNKCLEKKRLQLKAKVDKLKKQRSKIQKEIKSSNKRKIYEKDLKGKETSRDTECCNDKWANFTSVGVGLGLAPTVIKQVIKLHFQIMTQFQVNSILTSDRTLIKNKSKQDDFLEHQSILQQALTAKPCDDGNANGKPPTPQRLLTLSFSRFT